MSPRSAPPRLARRLVAWRFSGERAELILGDLDESFTDAIAAGVSGRRAARRYWRQAVASALPRSGGDVSKTERAHAHEAHRRRGVVDMGVQDLRYAGRMLRQAPWWTLAVVLTIALSIGANTAVFSVVNAVMLRRLPFDQPDRLVWIAERNDRLNLPQFAASVLNYLSWKDGATKFESMGAFGFGSFTLTGSGEPEQFAGGRLTPSLFPLLGLKPVAGRAFEEGDDRPGAEPVVMISEALWRHRFAGDPATIGRRVVVNGVPTTVIGVAPTDLGLLSSGDLWRPLTVDPGREMRLNHTIFAVGRVRRDTTLASAQSELDTVAANMTRVYPEMRDWGVRLVTFHDFFVSPQLSTMLLMLLSAVGCVLLIASANVANLLLARASSRQQEMAVRVALGATRGRIASQILVESLALAALGGAGGLALAVWAVRVLQSVLPQNLLPVSDFSMDTTVMLFAVGLVAMTGLLFGVAPAWRAAGLGMTAVLKSGRGSTGDRKRLRGVLAATQLGLATMLLIGAGLMAQSLIRLQHVSLGFDSDRLLTFQLALPPVRYADNRGTAFYHDLLASLRETPGVLGAATSSGIPFGPGNYTTTPIETKGPSPLPPDAAVPTDWRIVSPKYFETMRIPLLRGREFDQADVSPTAMVVIVSQATARRFWGDGDPLGRILHRQGDVREYTVVGLVGEVRHSALSRESPTVYYPSSIINTWPTVDVVIRTAGDPMSVLPVVRQRVKELDANLPVSTPRTLEDWLATSASPSRLNAVLMTTFAFVAVSIAAIGVYSVLAYSVNQRSKEIGVRIALGAPRTSVLRLIIGEGMRVGVPGIAMGVAAAFAVSRYLGNLVYGVTVKDPWTYAAVSVTLAVVALAACAIPAQKAARVDPIVALRQE